MRIPDGWLDYKPVGDVIDGTRFIAFKVPLKEACVRRNLPPKEWFTTKSLLSELKDQGKELGLVIDLTNTNKYYNKNDFESINVKHEKILTPGKVIPSSEICQRFQDIVNEFLQANPDNESLIGVHCTHGLNRTGYIVCRYLIDYLKQQPETAIAAFNKARGHPMERENYLNALRYGPDSDIVRNAPKEKHRRDRDKESRGGASQSNWRSEATQNDWRSEASQSDWRSEASQSDWRSGASQNDWRSGAGQNGWRSHKNHSYSRSQSNEPSRGGYRGYEDESSGSRLDKPWRQSSNNRESPAPYGGMNYSRGLDSYNSGYNNDRQYSDSGWSSYSRPRDTRPRPSNRSRYHYRRDSSRN